MMKQMKKLKRFSVLALMVVGAQGAWGQTTEDLTLYDAGASGEQTNSSLIESNNGETRNVTLSGRKLYRDGEWNTLCLPFSMDAVKIASSDLAGATVKELDVTKSSLDSYGDLTLTFKEAESIEVGKPYIVRWDNYFTIRTAEDWETFINNASNYSGKTVQLATDDIIVTAGTMVTSDNPFKGTFDGGGHTITCNIDNAGTAGDVRYIGTAPFSYIQDATIKNLKVTGTVKGGNHCAGLVGLAAGTNTITNCEVDVYVTCSSTNCGGILGHGQSSATTITNCLYSGSITGGTAAVGIICGWSDSGGSTTITNCLANGTYTTTGTVEMIKGNGTNSATNCHQKNNESTSDLVSTLGSDNWEVSGNYAVPKMAAISNTIENPVFPSVTIANTNTPSEVTFTDGTGTFKGNYDLLPIQDGENGNRDEILLLSSGNKLGYANSNRTLNAFRAYFEIPVSNGSRSVRSFVLNFGDDEETGIISLTADPSPKGEGTDYTYDLQGRKVTNPAKGLYIVNGKKVFIK